jgi:hypothetical protein
LSHIEDRKYSLVFLFFPVQSSIILVNNSGTKTNENFIEVAEDSDLEPGQAVDYRQAEQGRNVEPKSGDNTVKPRGRKGGKKGKQAKEEKGARGGGGGGAAKRTIKEEALCSFCANPMTQSENMNWHPIESLKNPKKRDGSAPYRSPPGAPQGKVSAVLCDDDERALESGQTRDFRTVVVERTEDGKIVNLPVSDIANYQA